MQFELSSYDRCSSLTAVINESQVTVRLHLKIPQAVASSSKLVSIHSILPEMSELPLDSVYIERGKPWIEICTDDLDLSPGYHLYKFRFVDKFFRDEPLLFFSYIIQTDSPEKSYDYMAKHRNTNKEANA